MKQIICALFALILYNASHAQTNSLLGQYFQNMQAYNPAHVGMNNFLDLNAGMRQQWAGFKGAPSTMYLGANGVLRFGKAQASAETTPPGMKHGIGGYLLSDVQGPYKQSEISLAYAAHVPLAQETYLALGASPSIYNSKVDLSDVWVKDMVNDATYQAILQSSGSNTYFHLSMGLSLYSKKYYVSYSMMEVANVALSGSNETNQVENPTRHHFLAGYRFDLRNNMELMPNAFIRIDQSKPTFYEVGMRARYLKNYWAGVSVRNDNTYVGMLGFMFNQKIRFGYSYEYKTQDISKYNSGTHEINLGLRLFNKSNAISIW